MTPSIPRSTLPFCFVLLLASVTGCGLADQNGADAGPGLAGNTDGGPTSCGLDELPYDGGSTVAVDAGGPTPGYPAAFPTQPQVVNAGGPVLASPKWVPLFFANDDPTEVCTLSTFFRRTAASVFWKPVSEYGVGPVQSVTPILLAENAPGTIDDSTSNSPLVMWLQGEISSGKVPMPDSNTVYAINYPAGTTVTQDGDSSCVDFGGYHSDMQLANGMTVAYTVVTRCPTDQYYTDIEYFTQSESHELVESTTDPYPDYSPAWVQVDNAFLEWDGADGGSEVADMCENDPQAYWVFQDSPFEVQRFWSNAAAAAGHDPCVPAMPNEVYFNAMPVMNGMVSYDDPEINMTGTLPGVNIAVGSSQTIPLELYSDGPTGGTWTVSVQDYNQYFNGTAPDLSFSLNQTAGQNGETLQLTITPMTAGPGNTDIFFVISTQGTGNSAISHYSLGIVGD